MCDEFDFENMDWDNIMNLKELNLYYEAHCEGIDGENFDFSIYLEDDNADAKIPEISDILNKTPDIADNCSYWDIDKKSDDKISVFIDLGSAENDPVPDILKAFNNVSGIKKLIINEGMEDMF